MALASQPKSIAELRVWLDRVENRQMATLNSVEDGMETRVRRMRGLISDLGLSSAQLEAAAPRASGALVFSFVRFREQARTAPK